MNDQDSDPSPGSRDDSHGTATTGLAGAAGNNDVCGVGVAFNANVAMIRLLGGNPTSSDIAIVLNYLKFFSLLGTKPIRYKYFCGYFF
jgi:kexin